jgi:hypothetical protein
METLEAAGVTTERGVEGIIRAQNSRRGKSRCWHSRAGRQRSRRSGRDREMAPPLAWTCRRANLLVEGVRLPRAKGAVLTFGDDVVLKVIGETVPCGRMDEVRLGSSRRSIPTGGAG